MLAKPHEEIWEGIFAVVYNRESARDKDFKSWAKSHHHSSKSIYPHRERLMRLGVIAHNDKEKTYVLVPIYFEQKSKILRYLRFLRSNKPDKMKTGALGLYNVYASNAVLLGRKQSIDAFLQTTRIRGKIKGKDLVDIVQIKQVWKFFLEALNDVKRYSFVLPELVPALQGACAVAKRIEKANPLVVPLTSKLYGALAENVRLAIFTIVRSEMYAIYERIAIKLIVLLRDMDDSNTQLVAIIKDLFKESIRHVDFSNFERLPSDEACPVRKIGIDNIWEVPGDYSDLFKAVYYLLDDLGKNRMPSMLEEWTDRRDINLSRWAQLFLNVPLSQKKRVIRSGKRLTRIN